MPHGFCVPQQRVEKLRGPGTAGGGIITISTCSVGLMSMETTGLMPVDSLMSLAQLNGMGVQFMGSSSIGCASMHFSLVVSSSFTVIFTQLSGVVVLIVSGTVLVRQAVISPGGSAMVSGPVFYTFSSSLVLTFVLRSSSMSRTSVGNGTPLFFSHLCRMHCAFSSICSIIMVTGLHQSTVVAGSWTDSGCADGFVGTGLRLVVGVGRL